MYYFGIRVLDSEDLVANFSLMGLCSLHMLLFFIPYWSNAAMAMFHYASVSDLEKATHVFVKAYHRKQHTTYTGIVPLCYIEDSDSKGRKRENSSWKTLYIISHSFICEPTIPMCYKAVVK
jgi:hypothetical protein